MSSPDARGASSSKTSSTRTSDSSSTSRDSDEPGELGGAAAVEPELLPKHDHWAPAAGAPVEEVTAATVAIAATPGASPELAFPRGCREPTPTVTWRSRSPAAPDPVPSRGHEAAAESNPGGGASRASTPAHCRGAHDY
jgi:hypothetical protein